MDGCYLPCTPKFQRDMEQVEDQVLDNDTRQLINDFLKVYAGIYILEWHQSKALLTMKRAVDDRLKKHGYYYNGMRNELRQTTLNNRGDDVSFVQYIARSMFSEGNTSWYRIGSVLAFGATVCQCYMAEGREDCVERVAQEISTYLLSDHRDWLVRNNGWYGFVDYFTVSCAELSVWSLVAFVGLAGIAAAVIMLFNNIIMRVSKPEERAALMVCVGLAGISAALAVVIQVMVIGIRMTVQSVLLIKRRPYPLPTIKLFMVAATQRKYVGRWDFGEEEAVPQNVRFNKYMSVTDGESVKTITLFKYVATKMHAGHFYSVRNYFVTDKKQLNVTSKSKVY